MDLSYFSSKIHVKRPHYSWIFPCFTETALVIWNNHLRRFPYRVPFFGNLWVWKSTGLTTVRPQCPPPSAAAYWHDAIYKIISGEFTFKLCKLYQDQKWPWGKAGLKSTNNGPFAEIHWVNWMPLQTKCGFKQFTVMTIRKSRILFSKKIRPPWQPLQYLRHSFCS